MSMADYEATFIELSRFAKAFVADEREKCRLFYHGLKLPIKAKTRMQHYNSYYELVQGALKVEEIKKEFSSRRHDKDKKRISFFLAKIWFQKFKGPQRSG